MKKLLVGLSLFTYLISHQPFIYAEQITNEQYITSYTKELIIKKSEVEKKYRKGTLYTLAFDSYFNRLENNFSVDSLYKLLDLQYRLEYVIEENDFNKVLLEYISIKITLFQLNNDIIEMSKVAQQEDPLRAITSSITNYYAFIVGLSEMGEDKIEEILKNSYSEEEIKDISKKFSSTIAILNPDYNENDMGNNSMIYSKALQVLHFENRSELVKKGVWEINSKSYRSYQNVMEISNSIKYKLSSWDSTQSPEKETIENFIEGNPVASYESNLGTIYVGKPDYDKLDIDFSAYDFVIDIPYKIAYVKSGDIDQTISDKYQIIGFEKTYKGDWIVRTRGNYFPYSESATTSLFKNSKTGVYLKNGDVIKNEDIDLYK